MKLEVRCCCQPQKLLGWLEFPSSCGEDNPPREIQFARMLGYRWGDNGQAAFGAVVLPIARVNVGERSYFAIKAEGMTVEELLLIRGFTAA